MTKTKREKHSFDIPPILLLVFNRPKETQRLFSVLQAQKPKQLYIAADGPRGIGGDLEKCKKVREILSKIDWDCKVKKLYREENVGLEKGLGEALSWFFNQVQMGIVLEDDCIPNPTFFNFCSVMLHRYKDNPEIMAVNGSSFLPPQVQNSQSYYISKYVHFWGWASWKRAWKLYDPTMKDWPVFKQSNSFRDRLPNKWERHYFSMLFDSTYKGRTNSWGYRWLYSVWKNNGRSISPGVNLIQNIGFNKDATHPVIRKFELMTTPIKNSATEASKAFAMSADKKTAQRYYAISPLMILALKLFYALKK